MSSKGNAAIFDSFRFFCCQYNFPNWVVMFPRHYNIHAILTIYEILIKFLESLNWISNKIL